MQNDKDLDYIEPYDDNIEVKSKQNKKDNEYNIKYEKD